MSNTTTPGNSFLPSHTHDPALDPENEYNHRHHNHEVAPTSDAVYSSAHHPREQSNEFSPSQVTNSKDEYSSNIKEYSGLVISPAQTGETATRSRFSNWYTGYVNYWHALVFVLVTAWWIASLILHRPGQTKHKVYNWVVPFLLWLFVTIRLLTFHVSLTPLFKVIGKVWNRLFVSTLHKTIPKAYRGYAGGILTVAVFLVGSMASKETAHNSRVDRAISLFGLLVFVAVFYITSADRKRINWKTVQVGLITQFIIALFVLRTGVGYDIFKFISDLAVDLLGFAGDGFTFLFTDPSKFGYFATSVLPAIIFFIAIVQVAYYYGILQFFIVKFAVFFYWAMDISGAES